MSSEVGGDLLIGPGLLSVLTRQKITRKHNSELARMKMELSVFD